MREISAKTLLAVLMIAVCGGCKRPGNTQPTVVTSKTGQPSIDIQQVLSWLPLDTETITVARGPFLIPYGPAEKETIRNRELSGQELDHMFESLPLAVFGLKADLLAKHLKSRPVMLAVEGARHFRSPSGLGEMPFEGCGIAVFADALGGSGNAFVNASREVALGVEEIEGVKVAVFQEKMENDLWTTFVAFPNKNIVLVATKRDYITEVLNRIQGCRNGQRALPSNLPEWKYVDTDARFWGVRHFDKSQANYDPSSPFGGRSSANFGDEGAVGLTFNYDPSRRRSATITYPSGAKDVASNNPLSMGSEPSAKDLRFKSRELESGVVEGSYNLVYSDAVGYFLFVLEGMLGHAIYI